MRLTFILLLISVSVSLGEDECQERRLASNPTEVVGSQNLSVLKNPDRVYAVLLRHDEDDYGAERVAERSKHVAVSTDQAAAALATLLNPESYLFGTVAVCLPSYGTRLVFVRGTKSVAIDYCFRCGVLLVREGNKPVSGGVFEPSHEEFARLFKSLFPDDAIVKKIR